MISVVGVFRNGVFWSEETPFILVKGSWRGREDGKTHALLLLRVSPTEYLPLRTLRIE